MTKLPKFFTEKETTRSRSGKQEKSLAQEFGMRTTANSGATFGENDLKGKKWEIEAKTTKASQFTLKIKDWAKMEEKLGKNKNGCMIIQFEDHDLQLAVIDLNHIKNLIE